MRRLEMHHRCFIYSNIDVFVYHSHVASYTIAFPSNSSQTKIQPTCYFFGVKAFLALDARNVRAVEAFFTSPDEGGWEDLSAASYLLDNAFRTSSTKALNSLPLVKVCSLCLVATFIVSRD